MKSDKISGTKKGVKCEVNECEATGDWLWEPLYEQFGQMDKYSSRIDHGALLEYLSKSTGNIVASIKPIFDRVKIVSGWRKATYVLYAVA